MSALDDKSICLEPDTFYHIFNRGNNHENIFYGDNNYFFFLRKYYHYLSGYLDTYAYCLLPNHFHFLIRVKAEKQLLIAAERDMSGLSKDISLILSERLRLLFLSYAKAINHQQKRRGSLFQKPFRRKKVDSEHYFMLLIWYIHNNPIHHNICTHIPDYYWSSYHAIISEKPTKLQRNEVVGWFRSKENFINFHRQSAEMNTIQSIIIE